MTEQTAGGIIVPASGRLVACLGVDDLVVVDTHDALLITTRARSQEVRVATFLDIALTNRKILFRLKNSSQNVEKLAGNQYYKYKPSDYFHSNFDFIYSLGLVTISWSSPCS